MHSDMNPGSTPPLDDKRSWYKGLTGYQWFVFAVASMAWLFDTMDQQLFNLARKPAVAELLVGTVEDQNLRVKVAKGLDLPVEAVEESPEYKKAFDAQVNTYGGYATSIFIAGWAIGGIIFGVLGDKFGRARILLATVLMYSICTGLSALSKGAWGQSFEQFLAARSIPSVFFWDFSFYRFITGLGVGGVFAVAATMVAEVMPDRSRTSALGMLQALSAVGNMVAASTGIFLGLLQGSGRIDSAWRIYFLIGLAPALLAIPIMARLREPEKWEHARQERLKAKERGEPQEKLGSLAELFGDPTLRRNTIFGMLLASAGVVGLWGIGFFSFDLIRSVFEKHFAAQNLDQRTIAGRLTLWTGIASLVQNGGAFLGIMAFTWLTKNKMGRKATFALFLVLALVMTATTFWFLNDFWHIFVLVPLMGFTQLALFGGYAIYFPELFPTRLRSTGTSFCYNVGRLVALTGPLTLGYLVSRFADWPEPMRPAGVVMCGAFLVGLFALLFLPETKGKPLPE